MKTYARLAIGTIGEREEPPWVILGLLAALRNANVHVQLFIGQGAYPRFAAARGVCGRCLRYLDSWLMSPQQCQQAFIQGMQTADLGVVEGSYAGSEEAEGQEGLEVLCQWLDLPKIVIVDALQYDPCVPWKLPQNTAGVFLEKVEDERHYRTLQTDLEILYGVPVLGGLPRLADLRSQFFQHLASGCISRTWWNALGQQFARWWAKDQILEIARSRPWTFLEMPPQEAERAPRPTHSIRQVALAYDTAFKRYFCETLDALEGAGVKIVDFSPLRDERLPERTDLVYIGCGTLEPHLKTLAENHCMKAALRQHAAAGRPIYAEGGGAAYLCHEIRASGISYPMVGILPAVAYPKSPSRDLTRMECTIEKSTWLFSAGHQLRGYLSPEWTWEPLEPDALLAANAFCPSALLGGFHAIGSLIHINFAWHPSLLQSFLNPRI
jgi:cobyrinic acid a,c-diamide synthase